MLLVFISEPNASLNMQRPFIKSGRVYFTVYSSTLATMLITLRSPQKCLNLRHRRQVYSLKTVNQRVFFFFFF